MLRFLTGLIIAPFFIFDSVYADTVLSTREAMVFDIATTHIGLNNGVVEMNPLGLVGSSIAKGALLYYIEKEDSPVNEKEIKFVNNLYTAAGLNNLTVMIFNPPAVSTLAITALYYFILNSYSD